jgi:hypothetical protein
MFFWGISLWIIGYGVYYAIYGKCDSLYMLLLGGFFFNTRLQLHCCTPLSVKIAFTCFINNATKTNHSLQMQATRYKAKDLIDILLIFRQKHLLDFCEANEECWL